MAHSCEGCDKLPMVCKRAVVDQRDLYWNLHKGENTEPGQYWKRQYERLSKHYYRQSEANTRLQLRAQRFESYALKANRALANYEVAPPLPAFELEPRNG